MKRCMKYRRSLPKGSLKTINFPCLFFSDLQFTNSYSSFKLRVGNCRGLALPRSLIGQENSCHCLNQSDSNLKPIATQSLTFSRASSSLLVFFVSSHTSLCDWSRKLAPLSQPIRLKPKTNRDLVTHVFPRFKQFACLYFEFSLAP